MATFPEARAAKQERLRREQRLYTPDRRGPACLQCKGPTVAGVADPHLPVHPCCAEPGLMALARKHRQQNRHKETR